jgi:putative peptide zinc metalloprotease protein
VARATFSEHWHRIRDLTPRLRAGTTARPVWYRSERWHILGDPVSGRFHRLSAGAYALVGRLDGRRTIDDAWAIAAEAAGDHAPTQGEAIAILGQLWSAGLLHIETTPDVRALLRRATKGRRREATSGALSILFPRIPLVDPDRFLSWLTIGTGWIFSRWGFIAWIALLALGITSLATQHHRLAERTESLLSPASAVWAILAYIIAKLIHELSHGVACKAFARREGTAARVPTLGVMILLGVPSPYIDASAAWALRSKWRRAAVGAAGMYAELALAAIAAIIWSRVGDGPLAQWAFSTMLVAGISTVLFNANPLLRYDGYYILSDLAEIPNLARRATDQLWHLASRYAWGVHTSRSPARDTPEAWFLAAYALAAAAYRFALAWAITAFAWNRVPIVGALVGIIALVTLVLVPLGMAARRIIAGDELRAVRSRAVTSTALALGLALAALGLIPLPHTITATGIVESSDRADVYAAAPGALRSVVPTGSSVHAGATVLAHLENPSAIAERAQWDAAARRAELERQRSMVRSIAEAAAWESRAAATQAQRAEAQRIESALTITSPIDGVWIAAKASRTIGAWAPQGARLGVVTTVHGDRARLTLREPQAAAVARAQAVEPRHVRLRSRSGRGIVGEGVVSRIAQATDAARGFEAVIGLTGSDLRTGERIIARIELPASPVLPRWIDAIRRTLLERDLAPPPQETR